MSCGRMTATAGVTNCRSGTAGLFLRDSHLSEKNAASPCAPFHVHTRPIAIYSPHISHLKMRP